MAAHTKGERPRLWARQLHPSNLTGAVARFIAARAKHQLREAPDVTRNLGVADRIRNAKRSVEIAPTVPVGFEVLVGVDQIGGMAGDEPGDLEPGLRSRGGARPARASSTPTAAKYRWDSTSSDRHQMGAASISGRVIASAELLPKRGFEPPTQKNP